MKRDVACGQGRRGRVSAPFGIWAPIRCDHRVSERVCFRDDVAARPRIGACRFTKRWYIVARLAAPLGTARPRHFRSPVEILHHVRIRPGRPCDQNTLHRSRCRGVSPARGFWPIVELELPKIVDGFYQHVTSVPQLKELVGDQIPRLKQAQTAHWKWLFSGRFDETYFSERVQGRPSHFSQEVIRATAAPVRTPDVTVS